MFLSPFHGLSPRVLTPPLLHARQGVANVAAGAALLGDEYALSDSDGGSAERDRSAACFGVVRNPDFGGGGHGECKAGTYTVHSLVLAAQNTSQCGWNAVVNPNESAEEGDWTWFQAIALFKAHCASRQAGCCCISAGISDASPQHTAGQQGPAQRGQASPMPCRHIHFCSWDRYGAGAGSASRAQHPRAMRTPLMRCSYFILSPEPHMVRARNAGSSGSQRVPFMREMQVFVPTCSVYGQTVAGAGAREGLAKHAAGPLGPVQRVGDAGAAGGAPSAADTPQMQVFTRKRRAPASDPHSSAVAATAAASQDRSLWGVGGSREGGEHWREQRRRRRGARANRSC